MRLHYVGGGGGLTMKSALGIAIQAVQMRPFFWFGRPNPNQTSFGPLMGGRQAMDSEVGLLGGFSCGSPKISRCNPSREAPLALTLCHTICTPDPNPAPYNMYARP